jgi:hypothetical protein
MSRTNTLEILKLTYCGFSAKVAGTEKVVYCWKYAPIIGATTVPNFNSPSSPEQLRPDSHIRREVFVDFIKSPETRQLNRSWKGGVWGLNNFTVSSSTWFPGMYIGDTFECHLIHNGILRSQSIVPNSEHTAWTCNGIWNGQAYTFYMTDEPMPQKATDKLWMWGCANNPGKLRIKVLKRGNGPDVDCHGKNAPAAGEHLEPGQSNDAREQALFAINQEIGIPETTLSKCYFLPLGTYDSPGRDPRYWTYTTIQDDELVKFGFERYSSSEAHILYIETDGDVEPEETEQEDMEEIKLKWWESVYTIFESYSESDWMLEDHMRFIPDSTKRIELFSHLSPEEKSNYRF